MYTVAGGQAPLELQKERTAEPKKEHNLSRVLCRKKRTLCPRKSERERERESVLIPVAVLEKRARERAQTFSGTDLWHHGRPAVP